MDSPAYIKCGCINCAGHIEFPAAALGMTVACPHCGLKTLLTDNLALPATPEPPAAPVRPTKVKTPAAPPVPGMKNISVNCPACGLEVSYKATICPACNAVIKEPARLNLKWVFTVIAVLAVAAGGYFGFRAFSHKGRSTQQSSDQHAQASPQEPSPEPPAQPAPDNRPAFLERSLEAIGLKKSSAARELQVMDYQLEKEPGRSLVYVVGSVTNATDQQFFSVRVNFALFDKNGGPVGSATDYLQVLEPGKGWNFRALVLDTNAVIAKLTALETEKK